MPWLRCRSLPKLGEQPLFTHERAQDMQGKPNLDRAHRLARRSLRRLAQHLKRQVDQRVTMSPAPGALLAIGQR